MEEDYKFIEAEIKERVTGDSEERVGINFELVQEFIDNPNDEYLLLILNSFSKEEDFEILLSNLFDKILDLIIANNETLNNLNLWCLISKLLNYKEICENLNHELFSIAIEKNRNSYYIADCIENYIFNSEDMGIYS
ncbi:hypothetical protein TVAG_116340 [Trichomonas vaginalis G3]|uniref:Uncharacterized protein n=1 Tax=Trichomonas vaginalis (strain ATCC PRA-98 / G3) TaxID=412133 RepID=A2GCA0_TRIV3|nr:hypothetical protein TVAGG3_0115890 [Trichomonas vaginalis G3]EAX85218.1 hypothetical protein TVAG_116340 [Trichomonas vaginalis G3]KAI5545172.1 hypothetical protein TVAGG3_0115890 [Trichomonas vaginalis G3]|eukprot:XP_001298148.1 hypothetical protein [Trichomonas vaginalis G3]